ncbi:unnamed protein product, partial [Adineta steineri]
MFSLDFRSKILIHLDFTVAQRYSSTWISLLLKDIHLLGFHCCSKIFIYLDFTVAQR